MVKGKEKSRRDLQLENVELRVNRLEAAMNEVVSFMNNIIQAQMETAQDQDIPEVTEEELDANAKEAADYNPHPGGARDVDMTADGVLPPEEI